MTCDGLASRPGEVEILLAASCYRNRDKLLVEVLTQTEQNHGESILSIIQSDLVPSLQSAQVAQVSFSATADLSLSLQNVSLVNLKRYFT